MIHLMHSLSVRVVTSRQAVQRRHSLQAHLVGNTYVCLEPTEHEHDCRQAKARLIILIESQVPNSSEPALQNFGRIFHCLQALDDDAAPVFLPYRGLILLICSQIH